MEATQFNGKMDFGKYAGKPIHPRLLTLLNEVHHFNPQFTYIAKDASGYGATVQVDDVTVLQGNQIVGTISVSIRYRRSDSEPVFIARSENIQRERSQSVSSKHLKIVMKQIKEAFKPRTEEKRIMEITHTIQGKLHRMSRNSISHVQSSVSNAATEVMMFLEKFGNSSAPPTALPIELTTKLGRNWQTYLDNTRIANSVNTAFSQNQGICVRIEMDGRLAVVDLVENTLVEHDTTYDLPPNYQEKITMLKLVDEEQPIEHVGVRFDDYDYINGVRQDFQYFFLVSGATYTNC